MDHWINRTLSSKLLELKKQFPIIAIFGPRQSGKTTLAKSIFSHYRYINLESFEEREFAQNDSKGFLERLANESGVILDEIQKAPQLISYLQVEVDERPILGRFVITGSQNILLNHHISQSLAGRVAITTLLPLSIGELREANALPNTLTEAILKGFYPRPYHHPMDPVVFAESYIRTYVERDVRDIKQITSLLDFQKFMRLCAARVGQLLNLSSFAQEAGMTLTTLKSWLSILESCYIIFFLQPHHRNFNKRLVKTPKLYFYDTALACNLLLLTKPDEIYTHYLRGGLFESMIVSDFLKKRYHACLPPNVYFWRDKMGHEVDCLLEEGDKLTPIEIKSAATIQNEMVDELVRWTQLADIPKEQGMVVYGGEGEQRRSLVPIRSWKML